MSEAVRTLRAEPFRQFKPYSAYKRSGVEWLGEIPAHWNALALKRLVDPARPVTYGIVQCGPDYPDGIPYIRPVDMDDEAGVEIDELQRTSPEIAATYARSTVRPGDIVVSIGPSFGKAMIVPLELDGANLTQGTARVAPGQLVDSRFLFWSLRSEASRIAWDSYCSGATFRALTLEILETCEATVPSLAEQRAIAAFLDRETARIDALVAKKERLIELLQEKRTALITRAVTKGLHPTVPMKHSGVEWLGEIPAHWGAAALKRIGDLQAGAGFPDDEQGVLDEEVPFFKVGDMGMPRNEREMLVHQHSVSRATARRLGAFVFPPGTIVFAKVGAALLLNRRRLLARPSCIDNNMMGFTPDECDPTWAMYWLSGLDMGELANPGAVPSVNEGQMRDTPAAVPPVPEQHAIAAFLNRETAQLDALIAKVREAIERLKELRTALISAAVTGKIDVREEAA